MVLLRSLRVGVVGVGAVHVFDPDVEPCSPIEVGRDGLAALPLDIVGRYMDVVAL